MSFGHLIEFKKTNKDLSLVPTKEGMQEARELLEQGKNTVDVLRELIDWQISNGWVMLAPEDIGAMTESPILSEEVLYNENGDIVLVGRVYWFPSYMVRNELEELATGKTVVFTGEGKPLTRTVMERYDRLREKEANGEEVDWPAFIKKAWDREINVTKRAKRKK